MKIAFFLLHYPVFSETFVTQEIIGLCYQGADGIIVTEKQNFTPPFHPHVQQINLPIFEIYTKVFGNKLISILLAHFYWLITNPIGYFQSLGLFLNFLSYHHLRVFIKSPLLAKDLSAHRPDIIYIHEADSPSLYGLICSKLLKIPVGIILHTEYLFSQNRFLAAKIKFADFIIFQSQYSLNQAKNITQLPASFFHKCCVVYSPGVDTVFFSPPPQKHFTSDPRIISIGRLEVQKGFIYLIKAVHRLKKIYPKISCQIIGNGSLEPSLDQTIRQLRLKKNVQLLGSIPHTPDLINLLHRADLFVLPCTVDHRQGRDVHPNAIKEAMAVGLPVITSNLAGIDEIINSQNGLLLRHLSVQTLTQKIITFQKLSPVKKESISSCARNTILKNHQQQLVCRQLLKLFNRYVQKS